MAHSKGPSTLLQQENGLNGLDNELNKDVRMDWRGDRQEAGTPVRRSFLEQFKI